jgi:hypothetical protein
MGGAPSRAQILAELDLKISDAPDLAVAAGFPALVRFLRSRS